MPLAIATGDAQIGKKPIRPVTLDAAAYESLAGFRYHVRRFFAFSEAAIGAAGLQPAQYQAMLAIQAHTGAEPITISRLAERLFIRLNSAVELVGRLEAGGLVERTRATADRRRIELTLTDHGTAILAPLAKLHLDEHREHLPELMQTLELMQETNR